MYVVGCMSIRLLPVYMYVVGYMSIRLHPILMEDLGSFPMSVFVCDLCVGRAGLVTTTKEYPITQRK